MSVTYMHKGKISTLVVPLRLVATTLSTLVLSGYGIIQVS